MGWNARLRSGIIVRQENGTRFRDVDLYEIEEMWLDGLETAPIDRRRCPGFLEFIQYETGCVTARGAEKTGEFIGWTDGEAEYVTGITTERHRFHPQSDTGRQG